MYLERLIYGENGTSWMAAKSEFPQYGLFPKPKDDAALGTGTQT
jgi:hypothetical protein